jgi:outer membrane protein assembly factor BamB
MTATAAVAATPLTKVGITVVTDAGSAKDLLAHTGDPANLVHGLVEDSTTVESLTAELLKVGMTGQVTVSGWDGNRIPFVSDTVNVVVSDRAVTADMRRVLAPYGVVLDRRGVIRWRKAWPRTMDEWTHYLYAPSGNAVSKDALVGPPRHVKWLAGPEMSRHHDHLPSLSAMVSSNGRVFYIFDQAPSASILFPPQWNLIARDAFNGVLLWKKELPEWHPHLWPLKSMPAALPRRLVSVGDDVYVTLGIAAPITHLSAIDGSEIKVFADSEKCEELIVSGDTLLALCLRDEGPLDDMDPQRGAEGIDHRATEFPYLRRLMGSNKSSLWLNAQRRLIAYDRRSGQPRWQADGKFAPLSLATDNRRVYLHNGESLAALDIASGDPVWTSAKIPIWEQFYACYGASLVVYNDVVLFSGGENFIWIPPGTKGADDTMTAVSAITGEKLWSGGHPSSGYRSPEDLLIAQGLVWAPDTTQRATSILNGLDPRTGEVVRTIALDLQHGFHHRCYSSRATETCLLASKVGINCVAFDGSAVTNDHWVRGACGYGIMPANGLIYATPDPCNCFPDSKLNGFAGLAKADAELAAYRQASARAISTEKGPAFDDSLPASPETREAWPTYRADSARSGSTTNTLPGSFEQAWKLDLGGKLSAPVIADGRVFLSSIERHQVIAVDVDSGQTLWTHVAGGRVDSPPTVVGKCLYFGAADGTVTCLTTDHGTLVWRRRLAPTEERIVNEGRMESVWPVHGAVTYHNDLIYAIAGRNMFVDGGLYMVALDPRTGEVIHSANHAPDFEPTGRMNTIPSKPDILSGSGPYLFMRSLAFDSQCQIVDGSVPHLFAINGYLNDTWFHRAFWTYASDWRGGAGGFGSTGNSHHSGRIMASDDSHLYGFGRLTYGWGSAFTYQLYKAPLSADEPAPAPVGRKGQKPKAQKPAPVKSQRIWSVDIPVLARSLIKAGDRLLVAGPKRLYDENDIIQRLPAPDARQEIETQQRLWETQADLLVIDAADGSVLEQTSLDFAPVWDGLAVAEQSLFVSGRNGVLYRMKRMEAEELER